MFEMKSHVDFSEEVPKIIQGSKNKTQYCRGKILRSNSFGKFYLITDLKTRKKCIGKVIMKSGLDGMLNNVCFS
uniref:NUMOD4 domain-containing protein n=1 Tax=Strongyloides venezuelensis TaxID=75913 RepID=A0A0K0FV78_STRVS